MTRPRTLRELKASGYRPRSVKDELRANVLARLRSGDKPFPGIIGYESTVEPQIVNALLSRHDFILLGLRGQAKTRLLRALVTFLDEWVPAIRSTRSRTTRARCSRPTATRRRSRGSIATSATRRSSPPPT